MNKSFEAFISEYRTICYPFCPRGNSIFVYHVLSSTDYKWAAISFSGQQRQFGGPQGFGGQQSFGGQSFGRPQGFGGQQNSGRPQGFGGQQNSGRPQGFGGQRPPFGNQQGGFFGIFSNATNATNNPFAGLSSGTIDLSQLASLFQNFAGRSMARFDPAQYLDSLNLGEQATQLKQCIARETDLVS